MTNHLRTATNKSVPAIWLKKYYSRHHPKGDSTMTLVKRVNILAFCLVFAFIVAILFGAV